jgi:hypothetical protein
MSTIDASQCWRIMPFSLFDGETEWWVLGPDHQPVDGGIVPTKEQAFAMALEHNKKYGVDAVYVYTTSSMRKGNWQKPPEEAQPQVTTAEIWEQIEKDFEEYKKLMAAGAYPEAERVERTVREMKERNPNMSEEFMWKLAVSAIAARKGLNKEFFPVDPFEDPPSPETVAVVQKSWHIMPLLRDEDEGEVWWVLGPNNKHEASTAGPFKTRKEAFWMALEHNRKLGLNAVYIHKRDENGEIGGGDFLEPTEEDFDDDDEPAD